MSTTGEPVPGASGPVPEAVPVQPTAPDGARPSVSPAARETLSAISAAIGPTVDSPAEAETGLRMLARLPKAGESIAKDDAPSETKGDKSREEAGMIPARDGESADPATEPIAESSEALSTEEAGTAEGIELPAPDAGFDTETGGTSTDAETTATGAEDADPTPPVTPTEADDDELIDEVTRVLSEAGKTGDSPDATGASETKPLFNFEYEATKKYAEASAKYKASGKIMPEEEQQKYQAEINRGQVKDQLLNTALALVESQPDGASGAISVRAQGLRSYLGNVRLIGRFLENAPDSPIGKAEALYEASIFGPIRAEVKNDHNDPTPYEDRLEKYYLKDARSMREEYKGELEKAKARGKPDEIADAQRRYDAANTHYSILNREKRKSILKSMLKSLGLILITQSVGDVFKQSKSGTQQATQPQRH